MGKITVRERPHATITDAGGGRDESLASVSISPRKVGDPKELKMSTPRFNQKYRVIFKPDTTLSAEEIKLGQREAARQLHAIGEYPWPGLPSDVEVDPELNKLWKTWPDGSAERICDSHAHAIQVHTFLCIVENFDADMEPVQD